MLVRFYSNKERREGPLAAYLAAQAAQLATDGGPGLVVLLRGFGDSRSLFPSPNELRARGETACRHDDVRAVFWWTWPKRRLVDFRSGLGEASGEEYRDAIRDVAATCLAPVPR